MTQQMKSMRLTGWALIFVGGLFALAMVPPLQPVAHLFLRIGYWPFEPVPDVLAVPVPLLLAITGGLTVGLGGMMWALGTHVAPISPTAAARVARIAAWTWFCSDSTGSVLAGAPFNVVLNLSFLVPMLFACRPSETASTTTA